MRQQDDDIKPFSPSARAKHRAAEDLGRRAEEDVAALLCRQGYEVLARRLRTGAGEIDLVVANDVRLVFVEVKARATITEASYAILPRQQARLLRAATVALAGHAAWARPETRFDVALVASGEIKIIENAIWLD